MMQGHSDTMFIILSAIPRMAFRLHSYFRLCAMLGLSSLKPAPCVCATPLVARHTVLFFADRAPQKRVGTRTMESHLSSGVRSNVLPS